MKFLIDMNLSPRWTVLLQAEGWDSIHWSQVGRADAGDDELMTWAQSNGRIVITHDLDFGTLLAATQATAPSVAQIRTQDVRPESLGRLMVALLRKYEKELIAGALFVADEGRSRVRLLPLNNN